jgi:hypothetical protein
MATLAEFDRESIPQIHFDLSAERRNPTLPAARSAVSDH